MGQSPPRRSPGGVFLVYRVDVGRLPKGRVWEARPTKNLVPATIEQVARVKGFTVSFATNFPSGEASTTGPRAESREPAGSELQPAALGLVLDPFF